jgi:hypothetical protein
MADLFFILSHDDAILLKDILQEFLHRRVPVGQIR